GVGLVRERDGHDLRRVKEAVAAIDLDGRGQVRRGVGGRSAVVAGAVTAAVAPSAAAPAAAAAATAASAAAASAASSAAAAARVPAAAARVRSGVVARSVVAGLVRAPRATAVADCKEAETEKEPESGERKYSHGARLFHTASAGSMYARTRKCTAPRR